MRSETIGYEADGLRMEGTLFVDAGPRRPGILVFPDLFGIGGHSVERAEILAGLGYAAFACDLHGGGTTMTDFGAAMGELSALTACPDRIRPRAVGALTALSARPEVDATKIGAIGFCFGGTIALELARSGADLKAVVGFHCDLGTVASPARVETVRGRILVCIGADDPMIPAAQRLDFEDEMRRAGANWQMHLYGGVVHNFTNRRSAAMNMPEAVRYDPEADDHSWMMMQRLMQAALG